MMVTAAGAPRVAGEMDFLAPLFERLDARADAARARPFVTLSYAQSVDGSIAVRASQPFALSGRKALEMTHLLRSRHHALMVGINTVLVDDPRLTVRHSSGDHPQPVVLDSRLRVPDAARLWAHPEKPLLCTTAAALPADVARLEGRGARVAVMPTDARGRVELNAALEDLARRGVAHLMVEGGATVINSFLAGGLVDYCVITVVPKLIGGVRAVDGVSGAGHAAPLSIVDCRWQPLGEDLIVHGAVVNP